jgi:hypothetical protein
MAVLKTETGFLVAEAVAVANQPISKFIPDTYRLLEAVAEAVAVAVAPIAGNVISVDPVLVVAAVYMF